LALLQARGGAMTRYLSFHAAAAASAGFARLAEPSLGWLIRLMLLPPVRLRSLISFSPSYAISARLASSSQRLSLLRFRPCQFSR